MDVYFNNTWDASHPLCSEVSTWLRINTWRYTSSYSLDQCCCQYRVYSLIKRHIGLCKVQRVRHKTTVICYQSLTTCDLTRSSSGSWKGSFARMDTNVFKGLTLDTDIKFQPWKTPPRLATTCWLFKGLNVVIGHWTETVEYWTVDAGPSFHSLIIDVELA